MKTPTVPTINAVTPPRSVLRLLAEFIVDDFLKEKEAANVDSSVSPEGAVQINDNQE
ncbi:MAG TPA: hypothetical protein VJS66_04660 [Burkholderiales bacterium]|nr:hypothetical protein [Burkholderiales bacterium]